jgi:hypothetical protein
MDYEFNFITEKREIKLQYGEFIGNSWLGIGGPEHPVIKKIITEIQNILDINHFDVFIIGGILEDWITWDLDVVITGEFKSYKLKKILGEIVKIGFENQFYIDVVYKENIWRVDKMTKESSNIERNCIWEYSNVFRRNDEWIKKYIFYLDEGLYRRLYYLPQFKHIKMINQGYRYKEPLQIVVKKQF